MKKYIINLIILIASKISKNKEYRLKFPKVNLGCGMHCADGWDNIDGSLTALFGSKRFSFINKIIYKLAGSSAYYSFNDFDRIIRQNNLIFFDLRNGLPYADNSVEVIYCSHFIEHLNKKDAYKLILECYRVLKKKGLIRLSTPDLDIAFEMYKNGQVNKMLDLFFYTSENNDFSAHKYNYNFKSLSDLLREVGFRDIKRLEFKIGNCPDIEYLDLYPEYSLYSECFK